MAPEYHVGAVVLVHVARRRRLDSDLDERSFNLISLIDDPLAFSTAIKFLSFFLSSSFLFYAVAVAQKCNNGIKYTKNL